VALRWRCEIARVLCGSPTKACFVLRGWIDAEKRDARYLRKDLDHFNDPAGAPDQLTEHGALSKLLAFFSDLYVYLENQLVDPKLATHLFVHIFGYYSDFFDDLCGKVEANKPVLAPAWVHNIPKLKTKYFNAP
jgi:hypothetical protein